MTNTNGPAPGASIARNTERQRAQMELLGSKAATATARLACVDETLENKIDREQQHQQLMTITRTPDTKTNEMQQSHGEEQQQLNGSTTTTTAEVASSTEAAAEASAAPECNRDEGCVEAFDHVTFWVGNAKQAAVFYMSQFGFKPFAFRGLETGSRDFASHVVSLNDTIIQFVSTVEPSNRSQCAFLASHGDAVKDVAFRVTNIERLLATALNAGAELVHPLEVIAFSHSNQEQQQRDNNNKCDSSRAGCASAPDKAMPECILKRATIRAFGDVTHTFVERNYEYERAKFLPGYTKPSLELGAAYGHLPDLRILSADHIVGQFPPNKLNEVTNFYCKALNFRRFWSVDEKQIFTDHSGVKSHIVTNYNERVKMPLCEVKLASGPHSKAEEFVRYNNGPGIHHIALLTDDIISVVANMRARGMDFLHTPDTYYDQLRDRLKGCPVVISQDIEQLRKLKILVDFDESGYLLQIFTRPVQDRPTLIFEFIQRINHDGFGAGNFLALFKAIEAETALRGNL